MLNFAGNLALALVFSFFFSFTLHAAPVTEIKADQKCQVCGMFVAKYQSWIAQIQYTEDNVVMFDGVKDMMAYYFEPGNYGGTKGAKATAIYVKDYYTQEWIDGKGAFYVAGSDVMGPMGHELIPFDLKSAADNFMKDHKGTMIFQFDEITLEQVTSLRSGIKIKE